MNPIYDIVMHFMSLLLKVAYFSRETALDKKILTALLKGADLALYQKLYLAMVWDRVDIAEEKILATGKLFYRLPK